MRVAAISSQADAPNTIATPAQASARPNALRASAKSAEANRRNERSECLAESAAARPAAPTWRMLSSSGGVAAGSGACALSSLTLRLTCRCCRGPAWR
ncbi:hypothetical protein G6F31_020124 [Rhizopus arrhizus]|nr:hypothetical protein G6F31_020124 [Rhizopus arrhizus]